MLKKSVAHLRRGFFDIRKTTQESALCVQLLLFALICPY